MLTEHIYALERKSNKKQQAIFPYNQHLRQDKAERLGKDRNRKGKELGKEEEKLF